MTKQKMTKDLEEDCATLGIDIAEFANYQLRDVISKYRKKAREVHPDMFANASEEEKRIKTEQCQALNSAYERVLKCIMESQHDISGNVDDDEEKFMKENFGQFNFPKENNGSFTVIIQHRDADIWEKCLIEQYGEPQVSRNNKGTVCDTLWKFSYEDDGKNADLTLHIYKKPKTKKGSKILVQSGFQPLTCLYVFTELPKMYRKVC